MTPHEQAVEAAKSVPSIAVSGMLIFGFAVQEWLVFFTCILTVLQITLLIRRLMVARRSDDEDPECAKDCSAVSRGRRKL